MKMSDRALWAFRMLEVIGQNGILMKTDLRNRNNWNSQYNWRQISKGLKECVALGLVVIGRTAYIALEA